MTDEELTDAWEAGTTFPGGVTHLQHLRIAWVLHRRHGPAEARDRLVAGTKLACEAHGCPESFDPALTARWSDAIAVAIAEDGAGESAEEFLSAHPELEQGDLLGQSAGMRAQEVQAVIRRLTEWARDDHGVRALAIVGSWACQAATADSDLDVVLLTDQTERFTDNDEWLAALGNPQVIRRQQFGVISERRVRLGSGLEVEVGIGPLSWAAVDPIDPGTAQVVKDGFRRLHDPDGLLAALEAATRSTG